MEKINIAELLKQCPKGMELDCLMYDNMTLMEVDDKDAIYPIKLLRSDGWEIELTKYGQYVDMDDAKCVIFPKGKTTWEGFQQPLLNGDVVVAEDIKRNQMFIVKEQISDCVAKCYIGYSFDNNKFFEEGNWRFNRLATEEEKQKLFDALKDNGYKWNAETKTLEKLPKFKVGDRIKSIISSNYYTVVDIKNNNYFIKSDTEKYPYQISFENGINYELAPNKFDISTLKPFDKVLVRNTNNGHWCGQFYMTYGGIEGYPFKCTYNCWKQCIPYEGNEYLLDTTNDCDDFYKTW